MKEYKDETGGITLPRINKNIFAAIHLGSEKIYLEIIQFDKQGEFKTLEYLSHAINMGEETFKTGKISFASVNQVCDLLKGFKRLIAEYKVSKYKVVATTALRESENRNYIVDQIKVKTGFDVQVIDLFEEVFLKYKALYKSVAEKKQLIDKKEGVFFADITSGGLNITLFENEKIRYLQNIRLGTLRIKENFTKSQRESSSFINALEEYIYSIIEGVAQAISNYKVKHLVLSGVETELLLEMLNHEGSNRKRDVQTIELDDFKNLYKKVKNMNIPQLMVEFNLNERKAEIALPTIVLYNQIINLTKINQILIPAIELVDGIIIDYIEEQIASPWLTVFQEHIVSCARMLSDRYASDSAHSHTVEKHSLYLFDKLSKIHGYGQKERLYLQIAVILHDIGKFISLRRHYFYSYYLIISLDILGFSEQEKEIIANIAYYHSKVIPNSGDNHYNALDKDTKVTVAKLAAILRLADALDASHNQKIAEIEVSLKANILEVTVKSLEDIALEQWVFAFKASFFEEVFGIQALIRKKGVLGIDIR